MPKEFVDAIAELKRLVVIYESGKSWNKEFYERLSAKYPAIVEEIESEMGWVEEIES